MGPRPKWRTRRLAVGLASALAFIAGLVGVLMWGGGAQPNKPLPPSWEETYEVKDEGQPEKPQTFDSPGPVTDELGGVLVAGDSEAAEQGQNTNGIRSQTIASWFSNVTTITITRTADATTEEIHYRSNAVSQAEFAVIKGKAERGDAVAQYQLGQLYGWLVGGKTNVAEGKKWIGKLRSKVCPKLNWKWDGLFTGKIQRKHYDGFAKLLIKGILKRNV